MTTLVETQPLSSEREQELIEAGREIARRLNRDQLALGRLCLEYAPMTEQWVKTGAVERVAAYAAAIDYSVRSLLKFRSVAHSWRDTNVQPHEFPFNMLKRLAPAEDKEPVLEWLRDWRAYHGSPPTVDHALEHARSMGWLRSKNWRTEARPRPTTKLKHALSVLHEIDAATVKPYQRDRMVELVDEIRAEVDRINKELRA